MALFGQIGEQIRSIVGIHLFDDVGRALGADIVDERFARLGIEVFEGVGRGFVVELLDDFQRLPAPRVRR